MSGGAVHTKGVLSEIVGSLFTPVTSQLGSAALHRADAAPRATPRHAKLLLYAMVRTIAPDISFLNAALKRRTIAGAVALVADRLG